MNRLIGQIRRRNLVPYIAIYYGVGLAGLIIPSTRDLFKELTPLTLLFSTGLLILFHEGYSTRFWLAALAIYIAGFVVETIGVGTGLLFGSYEYGDTLGLKVLHTPLLIGLNWFLLVYCSLYVVSPILDESYFRALAAGLMMVVYDFALEPAAIYLDMWEWSGGPVPLQNYVAWFVIGAGLGYAGDKTQLTGRPNKLAPPLFFIQLGFFIILDIWIYMEKIWGY